MLIGAFEIHHLVLAAVALAHDAGQAGEVFRVVEHVGVGRAGIEPDVENVVDLLIVGRIVVGREEAPRRALLVPGVGAFLLERRGDARVDAFVDQDFVAALFHEHGDRHAPGALAAHHPVGLGRHHAADAVLARGGRPARLADGGKRRLAQRWIVDAVGDRVWFRQRRRFAPDAVGDRVYSAGDRLVHGDEPLRRVAEDDRLLRPPRMRVLVLEPAARDQRARRDQRVDDGLVGVAWLALVGEHAFAGEARRLVGEGAVLIDRVGDTRIDVTLGKQPPARHPQLEVLATVAGRGVDEAGASVVGDVIAGEQGDGEGVIGTPKCTRTYVAIWIAPERMHTAKVSQDFSGDILD